MSNKRRNINSLVTSVKHQQITKFVEKNSDSMRGTAKVTSTQSAPKEDCTKAATVTSTQSTQSAPKEDCTKAATVVVKHSVNNKRARPDTISPKGNTQGQPAKKQITDMPGESSECGDNKDNKGVNPLNPELMELKRQLFEGFDTLIDQKLSPLKKDIQELKNDRKLECRELNVETLTRKIKQSDAKHKKLENRLNQIEDQLLERILFSKDSLRLSSKTMMTQKEK